MVNQIMDTSHHSAGFDAPCPADRKAATKKIKNKIKPNEKKTKNKTMSLVWLVHRVLPPPRTQINTQHGHPLALETNL